LFERTRTALNARSELQALEAPVANETPLILGGLKIQAVVGRYRRHRTIVKHEDAHKHTS